MQLVACCLVSTIEGLMCIVHLRIPSGHLKDVSGAPCYVPSPPPPTTAHTHQCYDLLSEIESSAVAHASCGPENAFGGRIDLLLNC